jgi:hypothetical protein
VSARILATVEDPSGDLVALPGNYNLEIDLGSGKPLVLQATVGGPRRVLIPFPYKEKAQQ